MPEIEVALRGHAAKPLYQGVRPEDVDAHRREDVARPAGNRRRLGRLLLEIEDPHGIVDLEDAQIRGLRHVPLLDADGDVGAGGLVGREEALVVHRVDVVAGENEDVPRFERVQEVEVLPHGVRGAPVPVLAEALLRGDVLDELAEGVAQEAPPALQVVGQRPRLVLREDEDLPEVGVERVGEAEIDDEKETQEKEFVA